MKKTVFSLKCMNQGLQEGMNFSGAPLCGTSEGEEKMQVFKQRSGIIRLCSGKTSQKNIYMIFAVAARKTGTDNTQVNGRGGAPTKLHFQKQVTATT